jgi:hypothetical protein
MIEQLASTSLHVAVFYRGTGTLTWACVLLYLPLVVKTCCQSSSCKYQWQQTASSEISQEIDILWNRDTAEESEHRHLIMLDGMASLSFSWESVRFSVHHLFCGHLYAMGLQQLTPMQPVNCTLHGLQEAVRAIFGTNSIIKWCRFLDIYESEIEREKR